MEPLYSGPPKSGRTLYNGHHAWNGMSSIYLPLFRTSKSGTSPLRPTATQRVPKRTFLLIFALSATVKTTPIQKTIQYNTHLWHDSVHARNTLPHRRGSEVVRHFVVALSGPGVEWPIQRGSITEAVHYTAAYLRSLILGAVVSGPAAILTGTLALHCKTV